ncbi:MAG: methyltransferase domain-containing protein [Eubacteriaceae bacterium]|nr:methyltransferase domain-containing protein [Eubacteriaceae bacterium]
MAKREARKDKKYRKLANRYDNGLAGKASKRFYDLLSEEVVLYNGMRLLDVGCGTGALIKRLCNGRNIEAYGTDTDVKMVEIASRQYPDGSFQKTVSGRMPFTSESFDVLVACMAYYQFPDKSEFAREAARVLKPGGCLYIADPKFPFIIRKAIHGVRRAFRIVGEFQTAKEMADRFSEFGLQHKGTVARGYAQVVKFAKL